NNLRLMRGLEHLRCHWPDDGAIAIRSPRWLQQQDLGRGPEHQRRLSLFDQQSAAKEVAKLTKKRTALVAVGGAEVTRSDAPAPAAGQYQPRFPHSRGDQR